MKSEAITYNAAAANKKPPTALSADGGLII